MKTFSFQPRGLTRNPLKWKPHAPKPGHWRDVGLEANADAGNPHTVNGIKQFQKLPHTSLHS